MEIVKQKRNIEIDIVKGLAIILMVAGHASVQVNFIYLFHMAVFFMAAGYFYKDSASDTVQSVWNYTVKKFKGLWLPYALWTAIFSLLRNFFININVYTNNPLILEDVDSGFAFVTEYWTWKDILINIIKGCILPGNVQMGGALWFLATLLQVSIGYCVIDFVLKRFLNQRYMLFAQGVVSVLLLGIGYFLCIMNVYIFGIESFFSCYCLFYIGMLLHKTADKFVLTKTKSVVFVFVSCFAILCYLNTRTSISLGANQYDSPFILLGASLVGWFFLYEAAMLIKKSTAIAKIMTYIGQNTLPIVVLHFLAFKLVSLAAVLVNGKELYCIAAFPVLYTDVIWSVLYIIVGVAVPLGLNELWKGIKKRINYGKN